jgi:hypothetical protein
MQPSRHRPLYLEFAIALGQLAPPAGAVYIMAGRI